MHESSLMAGLVNRIEEIARREGTRKILAVSVKLGALASMSPNHFREQFVVASRGTIAEGAELRIEELRDLNDPHAQEILLDSVEVAE